MCSRRRRKKVPRNFGRKEPQTRTKALHGSCLVIHYYLLMNCGNPSSFTVFRAVVKIFAPEINRRNNTIRAIQEREARIVPFRCF